MGTGFWVGLGLLMYGAIPSILAAAGLWHLNTMYKASRKACDYAFENWIFWWVGRLLGLVVVFGAIVAAVNYIALHGWDTYGDGILIWAEVIIGFALLLSLIPEYLDVRRYYRDDEIM